MTGMEDERDGGVELPFERGVPVKVGVVEPELDPDREGETVREEELELEWWNFRPSKSTSSASNPGS